MTYFWSGGIKFEFYADHGLLALTLLARLQRAFDTLTELFYRMVLLTNVAKTVKFSCHPFCVLWGYYVEAYSLQMKGGIHIYR